MKRRVRNISPRKNGPYRTPYRILPYIRCQFSKYGKNRSYHTVPNYRTPYRTPYCNSPDDVTQHILATLQSTRRYWSMSFSGRFSGSPSKKLSLGRTETMKQMSSWGSGSWGNGSWAYEAIHKWMRGTCMPRAYQGACTLSYIKPPDVTSAPQSCVGLARTIYIRYINGIFGREIIKYTVIYGVYIRSWPTLVMRRSWLKQAAVVLLLF